MASNLQASESFPTQYQEYTTVENVPIFYCALNILNIDDVIHSVPLKPAL